MKKIYLGTIILFVFLSGTIQAQLTPHGHPYGTTTFGQFQQLELMAGVGFTQFMGDAGGADQVGTNFLADFDFASLRPSFMIGGRYRVNHFLAFRVNLQYGILKGHDQYTSYPGREFRNLGFTSPLFEWGGLMEFYFLPDEPTHNKHHRRRKDYKKITGYIATGIAGCYFNPMGDYNGNTVELRPLHTEGQGILSTRPEYQLTSFVVPVNLGFRYRLSEAFSIDMELCYRKSFSDYMDDISQTYVDPSIFGTNPEAIYFANPNPGVSGTEPGAQRGDPTDPDGYMFLMFNVSWKFDSGSTSMPKYNH